MAKKRKDPVKIARDKIIRSLIAKGIILLSTEADKSERMIAFAEVLRESADELDRLAMSAD
jgi:hypothetical protein